MTWDHGVITPISWTANRRSRRPAPGDRIRARPSPNRGGQVMFSYSARSSGLMAAKCSRASSARQGTNGFDPHAPKNSRMEPFTQSSDILLQRKFRGQIWFRPATHAQKTPDSGASGEKPKLPLQDLSYWTFGKFIISIR